jgi:hypothetical protein
MKMKSGKIIHLFIAFVLLVSTIGVVINKHYSHGELFSTALFVKAQSCCTSSCCHHKLAGGCKEESDYYRLIVDYIIPESEINHHVFGDKLDFTSFDLIPKVNFASKLVSSNAVLLLIKPPPKTIDIPVIFRSLLI